MPGTSNPIYLVAAKPLIPRMLEGVLEATGRSVVSFGDTGQCLAAARSLEPGCVVLAAAGRYPCLGFVRMLTLEAASLPAIVLDEACDARFVVLAMKAGAVDVLPLDSEPETIVAAIASAEALILSAVQRPGAPAAFRRPTGTPALHAQESRPPGR